MMIDLQTNSLHRQLVVAFLKNLGKISGNKNFLKIESEFCSFAYDKIYLTTHSNERSKNIQENIINVLF